MKRITCEDWEVMSRLQKTLCLEEIFPSRDRSGQRKRVHGVGANDANYLTQPKIDGKKVMCPAYQAWGNMLSRAYSAKYHARQPTYSGVSVCDEWRSFMSFRGWWIENQVDGWQLDKDLMSDSREYSPETCVFVPQWLNNLTTDSGAARGVHPIGVKFHKGTGRFQAQCRNTVTNKNQHIGLFDTTEEAHLAWRTRKLELALELKPKMDEIDVRIYCGVTKIIKSMR